MPTKKTEQQSYIEELAKLETQYQERVKAAWNDKREAQLAFPAAAEAAENAAQSVETIEASWRNGDSKTYSAEDLTRAQAEARRLKLIAENLERRGNTHAFDNTAEETDTAEIVADVCRATFGDDIKVITTTVPSSSLPEATPDVSPLLILCQKTPTVREERGYLEANIGAVYIRKSYFAPIDFKLVANKGLELDRLELADFYEGVPEYSQRVTTTPIPNTDGLLQDAVTLRVGDGVPGGAIPKLGEAVLPPKLTTMDAKAILASATSEVLDPYLGEINHAGKRTGPPVVSHSAVLSDRVVNGKRRIEVAGTLSVPPPRSIAPAYVWEAPPVIEMLYQLPSPVGKFAAGGGHVVDWRYEHNKYDRSAYITMICESVPVDK